MLESTFDITEWRMEVERVLPALKFFTRPDNKVTSLIITSHKLLNNCNYSIKYNYYFVITEVLPLVTHRTGGHTMNKCTNTIQELIAPCHKLKLVTTSYYPVSIITTCSFTLTSYIKKSPRHWRRYPQERNTSTTR